MVQALAKGVLQALAAASCNSKLAITSATSVLKANHTDREGGRRRRKEIRAAKTDSQRSKQRKSLPSRLRNLCFTRVC